MIIPFLMFTVIGLACTVFWIWSLVDCIKNEPSTGNDKVIWVLVVVLLHLLGALIYILARRPTRIAQTGR
jgi:hypothetical protein